MMVPQPHFFVVRPGTKQVTADGRVHTVPGPIVPLVAVDELPPWLDIAGVPRELTVEQTAGLCNLGIADKSKSSYAVKIIHDATPAVRQQAAMARNAEAKLATDAPAPAPQPCPHLTGAPSPDNKALTSGTAAAVRPADRMRSHWSESQSRNPGLPGSMHNPQQSQPQAQQSQTSPVNPAITASTSNNNNNNNRGTPTAGNNPDSSATEYCRHWCQFGTCKFNLQCRYLHAMPTTQAELAEVGLREIPFWYIAHTAAAAAAAAAAAGHGQHPLINSHHLQQQQRNNNGHHLINLGLGTSAAGGKGGDGGAGTANLNLDPRDVRVEIMRGLGLLPPAPSPTPTKTPHAGDLPTLGEVRSISKKAMKARVRGEAMALLRGLGLSVGVVGMGMGMGNGREKKKREINPLQKGLGQGQTQGRGKGVDKEGVSKVEELDMAAAAVTTFGGGGRLRTGLVFMPEPRLAEARAEVNGRLDEGQVAAESEQGHVVQTAAPQAAAAQNVEKLVDV